MVGPCRGHIRWPAGAVFRRNCRAVVVIIDVIRWLIVILTSNRWERTVLAVGQSGSASWFASWWQGPPGGLSLVDQSAEQVRIAAVPASQSCILASEAVSRRNQCQQTHGGSA